MNRKAQIVLICGSLILLLTMGVRQSFGLFLGPVSESLGLQLQIFSLSLAMQQLLWGLSQPFVGAIADKYGSGRVISISGAIHVIGLIILANADSAWDLHTGAGLFIGLAGSGCTFAVILSVIARNVAPNKRSLALGIASAIGTMGQITMAPFSQGLISSFGWSVAFMVLAAMLGLIVPLAAALTGVPGKDDVNVQGADDLLSALEEARRHKGFLFLTSGFFVCGFQVMFVFIHFPNFLVTQGLPPALAGWAIATIGLTNGIGTAMFGWAGDRYCKKCLLSGLYLFRSFAFLVFLLLPISVFSVLLFSALIGFVWLGTIPLTSALVGQIFGIRFLATLFGITFMSHQLGSFLAIWLGGFVFDATGSYDLVWYLAIGLGFVAALLHMPIVDEPIERAAAQP